MINKVHGLHHVLVKDKDSDMEPIKKSMFDYVLLDWDEFIPMEVDGHCTLDEAFEVAKDRFTKTIMKYGLKEAISFINLSDDELKLFNINNKDEIYELVFDKDILDDNSKLYNNFKSMLMDKWNNQLENVYYVCNYSKDALIHDDTDKKILKDHYFDSLNEFNNKISFLEYFNNFVVPEMLIPTVFNLQMCHTYFYINPDYYIIDDTITRKELQEFLNKHNVKLNIEVLRQSVIWAGFGYYFGITHGLNDIESKGFASMLNKELSSFRSKDLEMGVEENFKIDLIQKLISQIAIGKYTLEEKTKIIFYSLFDLFKNRIRDFEYKNKRLEFRISQRQYDQFMELEGKTKADKLDNLMKSNEVINDSKLPDINFNEKNINKWVDEQMRGVYEGIFENESNYMELRYEAFHGAKKEVTEVSYEEGYLSPTMKMINEELANMTPEDWEAEQKWIQQMEDEERMKKELEEEFANKTPEQWKRELELEKQWEEQQKMMKELEEEFANKTPEQWKHELELEKQWEEQQKMMKQWKDEEQMKKELEEMARLDAEIEKLKQEKKKRLENK